jgi:hypothetical protein
MQKGFNESKTDSNVKVIKLSSACAIETGDEDKAKVAYAKLMIAKEN